MSSQNKNKTLDDLSLLILLSLASTTTTTTTTNDLPCTVFDIAER